LFGKEIHQSAFHVINVTFPIYNHFPTYRELWDGPRTGVERAGEFFGVNEVYSVADVAKVLPTILARNDTDNIFVNDIATDVDALHSILTTLGKPVQLTTPIMERQRLIKSPAEIELMKKTCSISAQSFVEVLLQSIHYLSIHTHIQ